MLLHRDSLLSFPGLKDKPAYVATFNSLIERLSDTNHAYLPIYENAVVSTTKIMCSEANARLRTASLLVVDCGSAPSCQHANLRSHNHSRTRRVTPGNFTASGTRKLNRNNGLPIGCSLANGKHSYATGLFFVWLVSWSLNQHE